jgi:regulator of protease activity HflC (stomatin/prohibitin superfamily)
MKESARSVETGQGSVRTALPSVRRLAIAASAHRAAMEMTMGNTIRLPIAVAIVLLSSACSYARIGDGELGVVRTPTGMSPTPLPTGDWSIGSNDTVSVYNTRSQQRDERLEVLAANGLKIVLDTSLRYHVVPGDVVKLDKELGAGYYDVLLGPTLKSQARRVVGRYQPEEIYSTQREQIEKQIREGISVAIAGRHIELEAVLIRNVQLPDVIQAAINNKLEAEQTALKMKFVIDEAQSEAEKNLLERKAQVERDRLTSDGQAAAARVQAQAKADSKRIEGQAMADYQKSLKQNLTPEVLHYYQIQATRSIASAPNSKLVFVGGGAAPQTLLDLRGDRAVSPMPAASGDDRPD